MNRSRPPVLATAVAVVVIAVSAVALPWHLTGGRWFFVKTPSMGRTAPVGSLVVTRPAQVANLEVGSIVTFMTPPSTTTRTHRVVATNPGQLITRGDINGADDPLPVTDATLVGEVVWVAPALGWLLRALPFFVVGGAAVRWVVNRCTTREGRWATSLVGYPLVFAVTSAWLRPWIGMQSLMHTGSASATQATVVSTGLLPAQITLERGTSAVVRLGQVVELASAYRPPTGRLSIIAIPAVRTPEFLLMLAICATPLVLALWQSRRRSEIEREEPA